VRAACWYFSQQVVCQRGSDVLSILISGRTAAL
jgi:hypothetical protein